MTYLGTVRRLTQLEPGQVCPGDDLPRDSPAAPHSSTQGQVCPGDDLLGPRGQSGGSTQLEPGQVCPGDDLPRTVRRLRTARARAGLSR